ncbi:bifunctional nicotinamidase/pyrazinamidase [Desulfurobacterium atlanticum]|uniref:nicotinamidase n=1 Tax=Desulfurobacterium atlanticum TaxID=240169 RepID=A0A238YN34_9BACT|nr:bifunctional nicotinamidase/pyrazinamidase [Desulfurobacterium atlanticum]SNR72023.1 nicotinamidase/pyrazinamidase [Desulfurobacterium atlanticum]
MKVMLTPFDALIVVDVQKDFCPGGALAVPDGDKVVEPLNRYIDLFKTAGLPIFATRDWHPEEHISFTINGGLWPVHCLQNSEGAKFHDGLKLPPDTFIINKGDRPELEAYSGFQATLLESLLKERGIKRIFVGGLATDYCVKNTVIGGLNLGFTVFVLLDGVKAVEVKPGDGDRALKEMFSKGAVGIVREEVFYGDRV